MFNTIFTRDDLRVQTFRVDSEFLVFNHGHNQKNWMSCGFFNNFFVISFDPNYGVTVKWLKLKSIIELDYTLD